MAAVARPGPVDRCRNTALRACVLAVAAALPAATGAPAADGPEKPASTCTLDAGPRRAVVRVVDAETIVLDDGSEVRLVGALAPRAPDASSSMDWPPEAEAKAALARLVAGRSVELAFAGRQSDRYGRLLAHVFVTGGDERVWVQGRMLAEGHARAYAHAQSAACTAELMGHEALARSARAGLWSSAAYRVRSAGRTRELMHLRGTFQIVEGTVERISSVRGRIYLNFGADWRSDFSVGLAGASAIEEELKSLEGRRVRVRGWIERRNGPFIELLDRRLIEVVPGGLAPEGVAGSMHRGEPATADKEPARKRRRPAREVPGAVDL